jgi:hypothetical protein
MKLAMDLPTGLPSPPDSTRNVIISLGTVFCAPFLTGGSFRSPTYLNESNRPSKGLAEPANGHLRPDTSLDTAMGHRVPTPRTVVPPFLARTG